MLIETLLLSYCDFLVKSSSAVSEFAIYLNPKLMANSYDYGIADQRYSTALPKWVPPPLRVPPTAPDTGAPLPPPRRITLQYEAAAPGVHIPVWRPAPPKAKGMPAPPGDSVALHPGAAQEPEMEVRWLMRASREQAARQVGSEAVHSERL